MNKSILLTRPRAASERWATLLAQRGFTVAIEPLLILTPTHAPRPAGGFQAVMITSASALDMLRETETAVGDLWPLPCFCVGSATAASAREFGFTDIRCGDSDGAGLARQMAGALTDKNLPILHIAGEDGDDKAKDILAKNGFALTAWALYRAVAVEDFAPATSAAFAAGTFAAIPVFSPRSARILTSIIEKNRLTSACHTIIALGFSQAVADVLQTLPWRSVRVARHPTEEDMLVRLETAMTEPEAKPALPPPRPCRSKIKCYLWGLLGIILLAGAGSVALLQCPWISNRMAAGASAETSQNIAELQRRMQAVEQRLDLQSTAPQPPPTPQTNTDNDAAALAATVKNMQTQIAQLQTQAQASLAAAFAFWDLRETIEQGKSFAPQLAALRAAANDAAVTESISKLEPYAASGAPTFTQLRDMLASEEPAAAAPALPPAPTLWQRVQSILQNLISVHPLHEPRFAALENALTAEDGVAAQDAFQALAPELQQQLAAWREKLEARLAVEAALRALQTHFAAPPAAGSAP